MSYGTVCLNCRKYMGAHDWCCTCADPMPSEDGRVPNGLAPGQRFKISFKNGSIHGGMTIGTVTVVEVQEHGILAHWPDDPPGRNFRYRFSEIRFGSPNNHPAGATD